MKTTFAVSIRLPHLLAAAAVLAGGLRSAPAQTNAPARPAAGRYLIVVETSDAMKRRAENTQLVLGSLLASGLNGQLREGDTVGVWTFRDEVMMGQFPLQRWSPQLRQRITVGFVDFLRGQKYDKKANLAKVTAALSPLLTNSHKLTVLLVTDGSEKISGTPYDAEINAAFKKSSSEQKKQKMPFVTVLRVNQGEFIGTKVAAPPWPVEFPPFPPEPKPVVAPPKQAPPVKPLIVIGRTNPPLVVVAQPEIKPAPVPTPNLTTPPADQTPPISTIAPTAPPPTPPPPQTTPEVTITPTPPPSEPPPPAPAPPPSAPPVVAEKTGTSKVSTNSASTAVAAAPNPLLNRTNLLIAGGALILGAGIFLVALLRRPKNVGKISLITHSVDREGQ